ncbi:MAG: oligosaccharide flippase family protein [Rhizobium sp.]|nr:oligosaccharide flippase family protein [Rhizobium sp.]
MASLLKASLISTFAGVGSLVFGFASSVIIARMLGAHGTGLVAYAIWFGTTASTVAGLGVQSILLRYMTGPEDGDRPNIGLARALLRPFTIATFATAIGMLLWAGYQWSLGDVEMTSVWIATAIFSVIFAYGSVSLSAARGVKDFTGSARQIFYGCLVQVPFVVVGAYFFGAAGALLGQMVRHLPTALALRKYVSGPAPQTGVVTPAMKSFGRNTWFSSMVGLFVWTRIEFVFLGLNHQPADIGYFAVGMTLAGLVVQLPEQMSAALMPYFGRHHDNNDLEQLERSYQRVFRWVGLFIFPICFGGAAIMPAFLPLIFGPEFLPAVPVATILVGTACITAMTIFPSAMIAARERSDFFLWGSPSMAVAMVVLLALVVPSGGAVGASIVRGIVHTLWLLLLSTYCWSRLSMRPPILDLLKIGLCAAACAGVAHLVLEWHGDLLGLLLAPIAGALTYILCLRLASAIPADDVEVLGYNLGSALPAPVVSLVMRVLQLVAPGQTKPS